MSQLNSTLPFFVTMPHSGEKVPNLTPWLKTLPEEILMADVDRYIDMIYEPSLKLLSIPFEKTEWHRYAVDLNRIPTDVDCDSVQGNQTPSGTHKDGYHWVQTKQGQLLMPAPMSVGIHDQLTKLIFEPFHQGVRKHYDFFKSKGFKNIFHLDAHSMPSLGTKNHKDPGQIRADIVVSDCLGASCNKTFRDLVISAYVTAGFKVGYNWPYVGGRVTETYGQPSVHQHAIQVELNRNLYMNEVTKKIKPEAEAVKKMVQQALTYIKSELPNLLIHD